MATPSHELPTLYTVDEAAQRLGIPLATMRKHAYNRALPTVKLGKRIYFTHDVLQDWINSQQRPALPKRQG